MVIATSTRQLELSGESGEQCTALRDGGGELKCQFGSIVVVAAAFISMNHVECVSPGHVPNPQKPVRLAVAVNGRDFSDEVERRGQLEFTYGARLEVFGLEPDHGPGTGGTSVTIHGANFIPTSMDSRPAFSCRQGPSSHHPNPGPNPTKFSAQL